MDAQDEERAEPRTISGQVREFLLSGVSVEEILGMGYKKGTVRIIAHELEKQGLLPKPAKGATGRTVAPTSLSKTRGSLPEAFIDSLELPEELNGPFSKGMRFGMLAIVTGVRIGQELSQIGVQQARPLVDMARDMRQGEISAARSAATEAATMAAGQVQEGLAPYLMQLAERSREPTGPNPVANLMAETMRPLLTNFISKFLPQGTQGARSPWPRKKEEE